MVLDNIDYYVYLNDREKQDNYVSALVFAKLIDVVENQLVNDVNELNDHMTTYVEELRHKILDFHGKPSFKVPINVSLLPRTGQGKLYKKMRRSSRRGRKAKSTRTTRTTRTTRKGRRGKKY